MVADNIVFSQEKLEDGAIKVTAKYCVEDSTVVLPSIGMYFKNPEQFVKNKLKERIEVQLLRDLFPDLPISFLSNDKEQLEFLLRVLLFYIDGIYFVSQEQVDRARVFVDMIQQRLSDLGESADKESEK